MARARERGRHLDEQRRLADAGIAAKQQHRAAHEAAAGHAVKFGDAGREPRRVVALARQRLEREWPALARCAPRHRRPRGRGGFFSNRVPLAAGVALALPAPVRGAAVLTDEGLLAAGHACRGPVTISESRAGILRVLRALVDAVIAPAETCQHLVADGPG